MRLGKGCGSGLGGWKLTLALRLVTLSLGLGGTGSLPEVRGLHGHLSVTFPTSLTASRQVDFTFLGGLALSLCFHWLVAL